MKKLFTACKYFAVATIGTSLAVFFEYDIKTALWLFVPSVAVVILAEIAKRQIAEAEEAEN